MNIKEAVLMMLKSSAPGHLSGEEMAESLKTSRTTVWKAIKALQESGYRISGSTKLGYCLLGVTDLLHPYEIMDGLQNEIIAGRRELIHHFLLVDSTNTRLKLLAEEGAPEGTIVLAEEQTAGKGRLGRLWTAPRGKGIWLSILLKPFKPLEEISIFTLVTAVAVTRALKKKLPELEPGIKWPNDILLGGRKICGILTELKAEADRIDYLITGLGVNYTIMPDDFPPELRETATSVLMESEGAIVSRAEMAREILQEMELVYREYLDSGTGKILDQWREYNVTLGRDVTISNIRESYSGRALDIDSDGALLIAGPDGAIRKFVAGEVTTKHTDRGGLS